MSFLFYNNHGKGLKENPGMGYYILTCVLLKKKFHLNASFCLCFDKLNMT